MARVPYWGAVSAAEPQQITLLSTESSGTVGRRINGAIVLRLIDNSGVTFPGVRPSVTPIKGNGSVASINSMDHVFPGQWVVDVVLGPLPGENVFRIQAGSASKEVIIRGTAQSAVPEETPSRPPRERPDPASRWLSAPLAFEPNRGQAPKGVSVLGVSADMRVELAGERIHIQPRAGRIREERFGILIVGASSAPDWKTESPLAGKSHYLLSPDPKAWVADVPRFERARWQGVYPGIDLVFYGRGRVFEFDFEVAPGADPSRIAFQLEGAGNFTIDPETGDLVLRGSQGEVRQHKPVIYQKGSGGSVPVQGAYVRRDDNTFGVSVGDYDPSLPLVVDPVLTYGTYLGGQRGDSINAIAIDAQGNVYVAGWTQTAGSAQGSILPDDAFVSKLDPTGANVLFTTYLGGANDDHASGIALDSEGNIYVTGVTFSKDFPTTSAAYSRQFGDPSTDVRGDAFVVKLSPDGGRVIYATYLGGNEGDAGTGIAVDSLGQVHIAGTTYSDNFPTTQNAYQRTNCAGFGYDGFYTRLNASGSGLVYSTYLCGTAHDLPKAVTVDVSGNAYIAGQTDSSDFLTTALAVQRQLAGSDDGFIVKFGSTPALLWSTFLGGANHDSVNAITLDSTGNVYLAGETVSTNLPVTSGVFQAAQASLGQASDAFVASLTSSGDRLRFLTYLGGKGEDTAAGVAVDSLGRVYVAGTTRSTDFPVTSGPCLTGYRGESDVFGVRLSQGAASLDFGLLLGGNDRDWGTSAAADAQGNLLVAGQTFSANFATTPEAFRPAYGEGLSGVSDGFVAKIGPGAAPQPPCIAVNGVLNNGSMLPGPVSPGEIITIFGDGLGPDALRVYETGSDGRMTKNLGGTRILFDDLPAPVIFTTRNQVAGIVPYAVAGKQTSVVRVEYGGQTAAGVKLRVTQASPAILTLNGSGKGPGAILNQDYSVNTPANPAARGSGIMIFATGEGETNPAGVDGKFATDAWPSPRLPVKVLMGEMEVPVLYAGAAPLLVAGVLQVNVLIPENIVPGSAIPLTLIIGDRRSPLGVTVAVK